MKIITIKEDNVDINKIDEEVIRVKGLVSNDNNDLIIIHNNGTYQFPGGHRENNEDLELTLEREIKEETGISVTIKNGPFMLITEYFSNYLGTNKTCCSKIYYYSIHSNELPIINKLNLTEFESQTDFKLFYVNLKDMGKFLTESIDNKSIDKVIGKEMLEVIKVYKESVS